MTVKTTIVPPGHLRQVNRHDVSFVSASDVAMAIEKAIALGRFNPATFARGLYMIARGEAHGLVCK